MNKAPLKIVFGILFVFIVTFAAHTAHILFISFKTSTAHRTQSVQIKVNESPEWQSLLDTYSNTPCLQSPTPECLIDQSIDLYTMTLHEAGREKITFPDSEDAPENKLIDYIINFGDQAAAAKILPYIKQSEVFQLLRLNFLLGNYRAAEQQLYLARNRAKTGTDYGAAWALAQRGDYDRALDVTRRAMKWKYFNIFQMIFSVHTTAYSCTPDIGNYPRSAGHLAYLLAQQKRFADAYEVMQLLKTFIKNKYNGRIYDSCHGSDGRYAYKDAAYGLADSYMQQGMRKEALGIYDEIFHFKSKTEHESSKQFEKNIIRHGLTADAVKKGWMTKEEGRSISIKHCPRQKDEKYTIPDTAAAWRKTLDQCAERQWVYPKTTTPKEYMLLCLTNEIGKIQQTTLFARPDWDCF